MSTAEYANWSSLDLSISYNLPIFHEIDFAISDGYRRIPHGGIETGGLLFGTRAPGRVQIEAFRLIECEHAFGPSFHLSDRDIEHIRQQLNVSRTDPALANLQPVGWFIAHTRSELVMTDREAALFDDFFPERGAITILAKPEKFKPTRFAFLPRGASGIVPQDGTERAIILPLLGRAGRQLKSPSEIGEPMETPPRVSPTPPPPSRAESVPLHSPPSAVFDELSTNFVEFGAKAPEIHLQPAEAEPETTPVSRPEPIEFPRQSAPASAPPIAARFTQPSTSPELSVYERRRVRQQTPQDEGKTATASRILHWVMVGLTIVCAAVVGWGVYLRMQPAFIPVSAVARNGAIVITWPSSFTRDTAEATVRVNDGLALNLPQSDRINGTTVVPATGANTVKVELSVRRWLHDARGIVRYVKLPESLPSPVSSTALHPLGKARRSVVPRRATAFPPPVGSEGLTQPQAQTRANPQTP